MNKVSIIVIHYNNNERLKYCLRSVQAQSHKNFECIVVDDGSEVKPSNIVKELNDERFQLYCLPVNHGRGKARRTGVDLSEGDFITFVDSDDWICTDKIATQVEHLNRNPSCGLTSCAMYIVNSRNEITGVRQILNSVKNTKILPPLRTPQQMNIPFAPSLFRRDVVLENPFSSNFRVAEDFDFMLRVRLRYACLVDHRPFYVYFEEASLNKNKVLESYRSNKKALWQFFSQHPFSVMRELGFLNAKSGLVEAFGIKYGRGETVKKRNKEPDDLARADFAREREQVEGLDHEI